MLSRSILISIIFISSFTIIFHNEQTIADVEEIQDPLESKISQSQKQTRAVETIPDTMIRIGYFWNPINTRFETELIAYVTDNLGLQVPTTVIDVGQILGLVGEPNDAIHSYSVVLNYKMKVNVPGTLYYDFNIQSTWEASETMTSNVGMIYSGGTITMASDSDTGTSCECDMDSSYSILSDHIDGNGYISISVIASVLNGDIFNTGGFLILGTEDGNYYQPTTTYSNIPVKSEYGDLYHTEIINIVEVQAYAHGMYFCLYIAEDWEYLSVTPDAVESYNDTVWGWYFEELSPQTYTVKFLERKNYQYALTDITDDYFDDPGFENEIGDWDNDNYDYAIIDSTYYHTGISSMKLYDSDGSNDYLDLIIPNFSVENLYVSFWVFCSDNMGGAELIWIRAYTDSSTTIQVEIDVSTLATQGKWNLLSFKIPRATNYQTSEGKILTIMSASTSGTIYIDDIRFHIPNPEILVTSFDNEELQFEFQATMINWGRGYATLPYLNVEFLLYNSTYNIVYRANTTTNNIGFASYQFSDFDFNLSETYTLYCISYDTRDGCYRSEKAGAIDHYWDVDYLITDDYALDLIGGYDAGHPTEANRPTFTEGKFRQAFNFSQSGTTQHTYHTWMERASGTDWAFSFWYYSEASSAEYILGDTSDASNSFRIGQYSDTDHYWIRGETAYGDASTLLSDQNNEGEWTHILISMDGGTKTYSAFENGLLIDTDVNVDGSFEFENFGSGYLANDYFNGKMDDVRYFTGEVTETESREIMYLHSAWSIVNITELLETPILLDFEDSFMLLSQNNDLNYAIWTDDTYIGTYHDLESIPKNTSVGIHNFTYIVAYSDNYFVIDQNIYEYIYEIEEIRYTLVIFQPINLQGVGLPFETVKIHVNNTQVNHSQIYYLEGTILNLNVTDWFGNNLYTTTETISGEEDVITLPVPLIEQGISNPYEIQAKVMIYTSNYNVTYFVNPNQTINILVFAGLYHMKSTPFNETWKWVNGTHEVEYSSKVEYSASLNGRGINVQFSTHAKDLTVYEGKQFSSVPRPFQFIIPVLLTMLAFGATAFIIGLGILGSKIGWSGVKKVMNLILELAFDKKYVEPSAGKIVDKKDADHIDKQYIRASKYTNYQPRKRVKR